jgi:transglutaminase/protease-like cytokinesis protein 3
MKKTVAITMALIASINATKVNADVRADFKKELEANMSKRYNSFALMVEGSDPSKILTDINDTYKSLDQTIRLMISRYDMEVSRPGDKFQITFKVKYLTTAEREKEAISKCEVLAKAITKGCSSDLQRVRRLNDYLCKTLDYDYQVKNFDPLTALETGETVCTGYTLLAHYMMRAIGLECEVKAGKLKDSGIYHCWNRVKVDGIWRVLDVTTNDCVYNHPLIDEEFYNSLYESFE